MLFNDGPEAAPFMVTVEVEGGQRGGMGGADSKDGKERFPFEVGTAATTERLVYLVSIAPMDAFHSVVFS